MSVEPYARYIPVEGNKRGRLILGFGFRKFTRANNGVSVRDRTQRAYLAIDSSLNDVHTSRQSERER